jgi:hypothetical protein
MSKQIILDALASQYAIKQNEFVHYETVIHKPALEGLNKSINDWFNNVLTISPYSINFNSDTLEITPSNDGKWPSAINIRKRYSYRDDENNYYEIDYRSGHGKVEDNNIYYLTTLGKIAQHISLITENIENDWKPSYTAVYKPYSELSSELGKLEREINQIKQDIDVAKREEYKVAGFEHTISPNLYCKINYDTDQYELVEQPRTFQLETGRGKWDYTHVNAYKVVGPAKYNKIALQVKKQDDTRWLDIEVKGDYFDSFIETVYDWERSKRDKYNASETERFNRYNVKAEQTS